MKHIIDRCGALLLLLAVFLTSCEGDVQTEYTRNHAFFRYPMVNTTPELRTALNSPGMFCKISFPPNVYLFTDADGKSTQVNRTALEGYGKPMFIAGFLVGTSALPGPNGNFSPVAYDLVCPNCYQDSFIQRAVDFQTHTEVKCGRCGRVYDLNNNAIVKSEGGGRPLFRYRMSYAPAQGVLVIQN